LHLGGEIALHQHHHDPVSRYRILEWLLKNYWNDLATLAINIRNISINSGFKSSAFKNVKCNTKALFYSSAGSDTTSEIELFSSVVCTLI
jgi:hypothetical protein